MPSAIGGHLNVVRPNIQGNSFEIKSGLIIMIQKSQFGSGTLEDPNAHLAIFLEICSTVKINGVSNDAISLTLFPFPLIDKAKAWLQSRAVKSFTTSNELSGVFLDKCFPPSKIAKLRCDIV